MAYTKEDKQKVEDQNRLKGIDMELSTIVELAISLHKAGIDKETIIKSIQEHQFN